MLDNNDTSETQTVRAANVTVASNAGVVDKFTSIGNNDTFVFNPGFGHDTITGFNAGTQAGHDIISIDDSIAQTLADLTIQQVNNNTLITASTGDSILVKNAVVADVKQDIMFHHTDII